MPLSPNFTAAQLIGNKSTVVITDTSGGSDVAVVDRQIFFQKADSTYLVPSGNTQNYVDFPVGQSSINVNLLDQDYALNIKINWLDNMGAVLYTLTKLFIFTSYSQSFFYYLTQLQSSSQVSNDSNYFQDKAQLWIEINAAINAIVYGSDISGAQDALNRAALLITNQNYNY